MEIGKPDRIGEVGEETSGALILPRPERSCVGVLGLFFCWMGIAWALLWLRNFAVQKTGRAFAVDLAMGLTLPLIGVLFHLFVGFVLSQSQKLKLKIVRENPFSFSGDERFEFREYHSVFGNELIAGISAGIIPLGFLLNQMLMCLGLWVCLYFVFFKLFSKARFVVIGADAIVLAKRRIPWDGVQCVDVRHITAVTGEFVAVELTFWNGVGQKLARVRLSGERLSVLKEKQFLEFVARALGCRDSPLNDRTHDTMRSRGAKRSRWKLRNPPKLEQWAKKRLRM